MVIAIDHSSLALLASGVDVDKDGVLGRNREWVVRERDPHPNPGWLWTTDSDDTVEALQLDLARRTLARGGICQNRKGLARLTSRDVSPKQIGFAQERPSSRANSFLAGVDLVPIAFHVDDGPAAFGRLVERLVKLSDVGLTVVGPLALPVRMPDWDSESRPFTSSSTDWNPTGRHGLNRVSSTTTQAQPGPSRQETPRTSMNYRRSGT